MAGSVVGIVARARIGDGKHVEGDRVRLIPESYRKVVLLILAQRADRDGRDAFPSLRTIAVESGVPYRSTRRVVATLLDDGWVVRRRRARKPAVYELDLPLLRAAAVMSAPRSR